jgi:hypothetical protein
MLFFFVLPLFSVLQLLHWFAFLLDELLFQGYRKVELRPPLFVIGVPRSGTTFLHRILARDHQFTSLTTWECLLAPSVIQRKLILALLGLDRFLKRPVQRLCRLAFGGLQRRFDAVHAIRLDLPEEDYLTLLPLLSCFLLVLGFPKDDLFWRLGHFERELTQEEQKLILGYYLAMLQKHLYVHGQDRIMLSKNPAFCSLVPVLRQHGAFGDCRMVIPMRDPVAAYHSQLSSIVSGLQFFQTLDFAPLFARRFRVLFTHYYAVLLQQHRVAAGRQLTSMVNMKDLKERLEETLISIYGDLGLNMGQAMREQLAEEGRQARDYHSGHHYDLDRFMLDTDEVELAFAEVVRQYHFPCRQNDEQSASQQQHQRQEETSFNLTPAKQAC